MSKPKNILITGGCGFMGSHLLRYIYERYPDSTIYNIDALTYAGNLENISYIEECEKGKNIEDKRYHFIKADVCDQTVLQDLFGRVKFDMVLHLAAETHVDRSILDVSDFIRTNVEGTRTLLEMVRRNPGTRLVYISTDEVYGDIPDGETDENAVLNPSNPYSASKAAADLLVQAYHKTFHVPVVVIRPSNNYGTNQYPEKLIPMTITSLLEGGNVPLHGNGEHMRSWLHVSDFCKAVDVIAERAPDGAVFNISGEHKTNKEVVAAIAALLDTSLDTCAQYTNDRPSADFRYAPDSQRLQNELEWRREQNFDQALKDIVAWYKENTDWWKKIKGKKEFQFFYEKQARGEWH